MARGAAAGAAAASFGGGAFGGAAALSAAFGAAGMDFGVETARAVGRGACGSAVARVVAGSGPAGGAGRLSADDSDLTGSDLTGSDLTAALARMRSIRRASSGLSASMWPVSVAFGAALGDVGAPAAGVIGFSEVWARHGAT